MVNGRPVFRNRGARPSENCKIDNPKRRAYTPAPSSGGVSESGTFATQSAFRPAQKKAMRIRVSGKQMQIGETLPAGVRARLEDVVAQHFDGGAEAKVVFSHDGPYFRADCTMHLDSSTVMSAQGEGPDAHRAFDAAFEKIATQLRRYKRKLKNHHAKARARVRADA